MLTLRKILCKSYGFLATISAGMIALVVVYFFSPPGPDPFPLRTTLIIAGAASVSLLIFTMAWWTVSRAKPYARAWSIAASLLLLVAGSQMLFGRSVLPVYAISAAFLSIGVGGLIGFIPGSARVSAPIAKPKPQRTAGDGTSNVLDALAYVLGVVGYFAGMSVWDRWSAAHHLQNQFGLTYWVLVIFALALTVFIHESGHALAGLSLGMKLRAFIIGPFHWQIRDGRWDFQFIPAHILSAGGAAALVPTHPDQPRWHEIVMIATGPLANLGTGLIAIPIMFGIVDSPFERHWHFLAAFSTLGLVTFAVNLIPLRPESLYSDGARIYQLLSGGPWADLHRALSIVTSTLVTPLRPRDYDMAAIDRASLSFTRGRQALLLRLFATSHFLDTGELPEARQALADAEKIYHESASDIPAELYTGFIFDSAFLCRDASATRRWWDLMESKKPTHLGVDYWLARSALLWIENHPQEAREAWNKTNSLAQQLPTAGTYQFDRYRVGLLGAALDSPLVAVQQA